MSNTQVVGDMSEWVGMMKDFWRQVGDGSLTKESFQTYLEHCDPFAITDIRREWQEFYRKYFRMNVDFSDVIKAMRKKFNVSLYAEKLDKDVTENVRTPNKSYAIRVRRRQEADEEWKNFSANQLKQQNINCVTLMERLVDELKWYDETGEHMDVGNWTLCEGSRSSGGGVPYVGWVSDNRRLRVSWYSPGDVNGRLRARQAVSN